MSFLSSSPAVIGFLLLTSGFILISIRKGRGVIVARYNWLLICVWGVEPFVNALNTTIPSLSSPFLGGKLTPGEIVIYSTDLISATFYGIRQKNGISKVRSNGSDFRIISQYVRVVPAFLAFIALLEAFALNQGWIQPLFCCSLFVVCANLRISSADVIKSAKFSLLLLTLGQLIPVLMGTGLEVCRLDKCFLSSQVFTTLNAGNRLGLELLFLASFLLPLITGGARIVFGILILYLSILSGSRTGVGVLLFIVVLILLENVLAKKLQDLFLRLCLCALLTISVIPALLTFGGSAFTYRGVLWEFAKNLISSSPWTGYGPSYWVRLGLQNGFDANYGTHNIWLDCSVALGVWANVFLLFWILLTFRGFAQRFPTGRYLILALVAAGTVESVLSFWSTAFTIPVIVSAIIFASGSDCSPEMNLNSP